MAILHSIIIQVFLTTYIVLFLEHIYNNGKPKAYYCLFATFTNNIIDTQVSEAVI